MMPRTSSCRKAAFHCVAVMTITTAFGCQLMTGQFNASAKPTKAQSRLVEDILKTGGYFNQEAGADPLRIQTVYLTKESLREIRPTALAVLPRIKAVMIVEKQGEVLQELTGFLVERSDDLLANEHEYRKAGWIN